VSPVYDWSHYRDVTSHILASGTPITQISSLNMRGTTKASTQAKLRNTGDGKKKITGAS